MAIKPQYRRTTETIGTAPKHRLATVPIRIKLSRGQWLFVTILVANIALLIALVTILTLVLSKHLF